MKTKLPKLSIIAAIITVIAAITAFIKWDIDNNLYQLSFSPTFLIFLISAFISLTIIFFTIRKNVAVRKKAEKFARESEAQTQAIFNAAPDAVVVMDKEGKIVKWNPRSEILFGWTAADAIGKSLSQLIIPVRYREAHEKGLKHFLKTGNGPVLNSTIEVLALRKNNEEFDIALSISPTIANGEYLFIGFVRDITEKKLGEKTLLMFNEELEKKVKERTEKLISSENLYSNLFENMPHGFAYCKVIFENGTVKDYTYESVNNDYELLTGLKNITGKKVSEVMPGLFESDPLYADIISRVVLSGVPEKFETYVKPLDKWLSITLYSPAKEYFVGLVDNITVRKLAEQELQSSNHRLKEAQGIAHICNWDIDLVKKIHTWSEEVYKIYGINKDEVNPSDELFLSFMHPEDTAFTQKKMQEAFESFKNSSFEFRFIRGDGSVRTGCTEWKFEFDENEKPLRLFGILQDITERKEAEKNFKLLEKKILEQKVQEQKKIVRAIIKAQEKERNHIGQELHDNINQILASTKLYLGIAGNKNEATKQSVKYPMELIDSSIEEIRRLCHKLVTPVKDIQLNEMVQELLSTIDHNSHTKMEFSYSVSTGFLSDDLKLNIYRIIQEQINNISKYAEATNVHISIKEHNNAIHILISDDGKGFDINNKRKGIGISNMISRIESFNGKMEMESSPGHGCKTSISMPY